MSFPGRFKPRSRRENADFFAQVSGLEQITERAIRQAWFAFGKDLKANANAEILRKPKSGHVYFIRTKGGRRRRHVASAPGETHANRAGRLRRSISWKVHGHQSMRFGYGVSTTGRNAAPDYNAFVELGTRRMGARPSLLNAINQELPKVEGHFHQAMERELRK